MVAIVVLTVLGDTFEKESNDVVIYIFGLYIIKCNFVELNEIILILTMHIADDSIFTNPGLLKCENSCLGGSDRL